MPPKPRLVEENLRQLLTRSAAASSDFDLNPGLIPPKGQVLRPAAVLIAVVTRPEGPQVILTKRSSQLKHHPGQVAFPGGKVESDDASPAHAALRESQEEVGLDPAQVRILGALPKHQTVTNFNVVPFVAVVDGAFTARPEWGEVDEVFEVPLSYLLRPENYRVEQRNWLGQPRRYYTVPWGPYYIWGATARMLRGLAARTEPEL